MKLKLSALKSLKRKKCATNPTNIKQATQVSPSSSMTGWYGYTPHERARRDLLRGQRLCNASDEELARIFRYRRDPKALQRLQDLLTRALQALKDYESW